jgi:predicted nucleic acid-binding protein
MNLLDTDIIMKLLRKGKYEAGAISIITLIEILRGIDAKKEAKSKRYSKKAST